MKLLAFSDLHLNAAAAGRLVRESRNVDLVLAAGDFCNARRGLDKALDLLAGLTAPVVAVPGNCESEAELRDAAPEGWHVLHGGGVMIDGVTLFGLGYGVPVTPFGNWSCDLTEAQAAEALAGCAGADIFVTHSPPKGIADRTSTGLSVGSTAIREAIQRLQPKLAVCGHVHDCWGEEGKIGATRVVNLGPAGRFFEVAA
ncbi:metallophosphoesterase family protein [Shimia sp. SDUM112013]|uniref:metallophosphoesterase family protein n=1 Tax=Shimia sp. SDUM112013 TaxID=3136160 RepID=UPI0032F02E6D